MARVKRGVTSRAKHKKVLKAVKGQWGRRKNTIRVARQAMEKAMQYAYTHRRNKKRQIKTLSKQKKTPLVGISVALSTGLFAPHVLVHVSYTHLTLPTKRIV